MRTKSLYYVLLVVVIGLVSACQSVKVYDVRKGFGALPANGKGRLVINTFRIPKQEDGVKLFHLLGALGGANTNNRYKASIFDVTDDVTYIGSLDSRSRRYGREEWLEYNVPTGKRLLMLTSGYDLFPGRDDNPHVDFIEVDILPAKPSHIAVTQYGFQQLPYLGKINLATKHYKFCSGIVKASRSQIFEKIKTYMKNEKIDQYAEDFSRYCFSLSKFARIRVPNVEAKKQFVVSKPFLKLLKKDKYDIWEKEQDKLQPYNLMKSYKPDEDDNSD